MNLRHYPAGDHTLGTTAGTMCVDYTACDVPPVEVPFVEIVCAVVSVLILQVCSIYFAVCRHGRIMSCPCEYASGQLGYYAPLHYHYATAPPYYAAKRHFSTSHKTKTEER